MRNVNKRREGALLRLERDRDELQKTAKRQMGGLNRYQELSLQDKLVQIATLRAKLGRKEDL
jgi:hypothetical protein